MFLSLFVTQEFVEAGGIFNQNPDYECLALPIEGLGVQMIFRLGGHVVSDRVYPNTILHDHRFQSSHKKLNGASEDFDDSNYFKAALVLQAAGSCKAGTVCTTYWGENPKL